LSRRLPLEILMRALHAGYWRTSWLLGVLLLSACASLRPAAPVGGGGLGPGGWWPRGARAPTVALAWEQRVAGLRQTQDWDLGARAAVAINTQGWQAALNWRQRGQSSELHLSGPLGVGAVVLRLNGAGLSVDGGAPGPATLAPLRERLGFDVPLAQLRYWLLGIPDPASAYVVARNSADRAQHLEQAGWAIDYDRYAPNHGDFLPAHLVLTRADVRVRIVIDQWNLPR
jgi:outer membrane lipoprotein LolB